MGDLDALKAIERMRRRTAASGRAFAWLNLGSAVLIAVYLGLFVTLFAIDTTESGSRVANLLLPTVLLHSAIVEGARERAGIHRRKDAADVVVLVLGLAFVLAIFALVIIGIVDDAPVPIWLGPVAGALAVPLLAGLPAVRLLRIERARAEADDDGQHAWPTGPLSRPARMLSLAVAGLLAVVVAAQGAAVTSLLTSVLVLVAVVVALAAQGSRWSLARAGVEWSRRHWSGFAGSVLLVFASAAVIVVTGEPSLPGTIGLGLLTAAPLTAAVLIPRAA